MLIVEDDDVAQILLDMAPAGPEGCGGVTGSAAISLAREFKPGAITLDITLPDMAGWTLLDRFKHNPETRHIPVHVISGDENKRRCLALGAMTYLEKSLGTDSLVDTFGVIQGSVERKEKKLLIVMEAGERRKSPA